MWVCGRDGEREIWLEGGGGVCGFRRALECCAYLAFFTNVQARLVLENAETSPAASDVDGYHASFSAENILGYTNI